MMPIFTGDDPLSGIFAVLLTQPWASLLDNLFSLPDSLTAGLTLILVGAALVGEDLPDHVLDIQFVSSSVLLVRSLLVLFVGLPLLSSPQPEQQ